MRYYDAQIIVRYIGRNKARLDRIDIGIMEDWLETNQRIYADDKLLIDLPRGDKPLIIRSIQGSMWGTPVMRVVFKDGKVIVQYDRQISVNGRTVCIEEINYHELSEHDKDNLLVLEQI